MYRPAESVNWCQCCMRGVPLPDMQRAADLLGDHHTPQVVDATHDARCFHIYLSPFPVGTPEDGCPYNNFTNYAVRICKMQEIIPLDLLFTSTML